MRVFLGDLGHYTIRLTNNSTPLNIGFIAAYLKLHLKNEIDITLFKNPDELVDAINREKPKILGLSNYIWCQSISEDILRYYKQTVPDGIAVWGGPNFPMNELHKATTYLSKRPFIDFYIPFEGETPMFNIAKSMIEESEDIAYLKERQPERFEGSFFISKSGALVGHKIGVQIPDINTIPSPYLEGWMDPFLKDEGLHAMFETQRGCPYSCTFCHTGLSYYNKGRSFSLDRLKEEINYIINIASDPARIQLHITDSNFGMWPQDLEFAKWLADIYHRTGFPMSIGTSTGKGRAQLVLDTVLSHPKLEMNNAVQSMDDVVLKKIKRKNFSIEQLKHSQEELDKVGGKLSTPECILSLPYETRESHLSTLRKLINDISGNLIYQYTLMLLPGTEMYTDKSREECKFNVKYRLLPTSFGEYAGKRCFEIEEVAVGSKDLSFEEYLEMRAVFFLVHNIHSNAVFNALARFLLYLGDDAIDFFLYLLKQRSLLSRDSFPFRVMEDYLRDTQKELFDSKEEAIAYYSEDKNYNDLLVGRTGINLTHTYRTMVFLHSKEWAKWVSDSFRTYVSEKHALTSETSKMMNSIITHVMAQAECQFLFLKQRANIPTAKSPLRVELEYDIPRIFSRKVSAGEKLDLTGTHKVYSYYMRSDAIKYINSINLDQSVADLALIVLRMDRTYTFPSFSETDSPAVSFPSFSQDLVRG